MTLASESEALGIMSEQGLGSILLAGQGPGLDTASSPGKLCYSEGIGAGQEVGIADVRQSLLLIKPHYG